MFPSDSCLATDALTTVILWQKTVVVWFSFFFFFLIVTMTAYLMCLGDKNPSLAGVSML